MCLVCLLPVLLAGTPAWAQSAGSTAPAAGQGSVTAETDLVAGVPRRTVEAVRLRDDERIALDGMLDEPVWKRATPATNFVQIDPQNGQPATEETEVRMVYTKEAFYIGVTAFDSEPDKWLGFQRRRDEFLSSDDRFMWRIDTFLDERSGYFFEMNPSGLMADAVFGVNGMNRAWDGIWNARVKHTDFGWTLEIVIPFRTLNFDPNNDTWGINFQRTVRRKNEDSIWMGWGRNQGLGRMTNAGHVTGIRNVTQGHGLDIKPYGLLSTDQAPNRSGGQWHRDANAGIDLFYNPTPGLKANLTVNTDFAQTEVDQRQVNLTRFSLFFPERRDFFLDGATFFDFGSNGDGGEQVQPFFSRRIGLSANATPQRIDYGTKFNGQLGAQDVGFMHVRTGDDDDLNLAGEEFTAARVKRRLFQQSYVGGLFTRRDTRGDAAGASHTAGLDFRLATPQFRGNQNLELQGWWLTERRPGVTGGNSAFGASLEYPNDRWFWGIGAREVQQNFDPSVGFVARRNYRRYNQFLGYGYRPRNPRVLRRAQVNGNVTVLTNLRNEQIERNIGFTPVNIQLQSQDSFNVDVDNNYIRLDAPFRLSSSATSSITLPIGSEYTFTRIGFHAQTANRRTLAFNGRFETGGFYSGTRQQVNGGLTVRARPGYIFSITDEWNLIDLPQGRFTTNLVRLVTDSQFTPFMALVNNLQFDTVSRVLGWQSRFRWIVTPGDDLYVVYTHNWRQDPIGDRFATLDRKLASKVLYTHRF